MLKILVSKVSKNDTLLVTEVRIKDGNGILFLASLARKRYSGQPDPLFSSGECQKNDVKNCLIAILLGFCDDFVMLL